jgi:hypothetical protein
VWRMPCTPRKNSKAGQDNRGRCQSGAAQGLAL